MFRTPHDHSPHLPPINCGVQLLIHQSHNDHIIPSYQIQPVTRFATGLGIVAGPDDALDCVREDEVGDLIAGEESASEGAAVDC